MKFSAANCGGLIEAGLRTTMETSALTFSAANCGGLIEAIDIPSANLRLARRFPPQIAAASLKLVDGAADHFRNLRFPPQIAAASLKPVIRMNGLSSVLGFPPQIAAASLKQFCVGCVL